MMIEGPETGAPLMGAIDVLEQRSLNPKKEK
jgi:hypothetical protein